MLPLHLLHPLLLFLLHLLPHLLILSAGAEGQQEAQPLRALGGPHPRRLRDQPRLHLGGPAGPRRVPSPRPAGAPQRHLETDGQPAAQQHAAAAGGRREEGDARLGCISGFCFVFLAFE